MNASSVDIVAMLVAETTVDLTFKTNLFIGKEEKTPRIVSQYLTRLGTHLILD